jgi:hypothetical protein
MKYFLKITDELGFVFEEKCETEKEVLKVLKFWFKNIDETPLEKIEIEMI